MLLQNFYLNALLLMAISYLLGSFPTAFIAGRYKGVDLRYTGSKNIGAMNTFSKVGKFAGMVVFLADIGKGALAAFIADRFSAHQFIPMLAVLFAVIGHNWMPCIGFKGGKGIAAFLGGLLYLAPLSFIFLYFIIVPIALILLKDTYLAQGAALFFFSCFLWAWYGDYWLAVFGILITLVYSIKSRALIKTYFTEKRRELHPVLINIFKPFFKEESRK